MDSESYLTIGILVGRESQWLDQCLDHISRFKGPILVVGSHNEPGIIKICEKWGASYLLRLPTKEFSFSEQRQHLLKLCQTPWILMIDVDERIDHRSLDEAIRISKISPKLSYMVRHCYIGQEGLLFVDHQPRLIPVQKNVQFEGYVSNTLQAEHCDHENIHLANIEVTDQGAVMDPAQTSMRKERYRRLAYWELKRLAELAKKRNPEYLSQLGFRYYIMRRYKAAVHFFKLLLKQNPDHPEGQYYLAIIEAQSDIAGEASALQRLWQLATSGQKHYRIYQYLSRIHGRRGEHQQALNAAEQGASHHKQNAAMQYFLAAARYYVHDIEGTLSALKKAFGLWPGFAPAQSLQNILMKQKLLMHPLDATNSQQAAIK